MAISSFKANNISTNFGSDLNCLHFEFLYRLNILKNIYTDLIDHARYKIDILTNRIQPQIKEQL